MKKAVILLSGGLDSATVLALAKAEGLECHGMSFNYGQRHALELEAAARLAETLGAASHRVVELDPTVFAGASALTGGVEVPKGSAIQKEGIPVTYVPGRNTLFLAFGLSLAEVIGAEEIHIGVNAVDFSGYPDCRPAFIEAFGRVAELGTQAGVEGRTVKIKAPLSGMTKAEIIRAGSALGVDYALTRSCYDPSPEGLACGSCDSCEIRAKGFAGANIPDPTLYASKHK